MPEWDVRVAVEGSVDPDAMLAIQERLDAHHAGAVGSPGDVQVALRLTVEADDVVGAYCRALTLAREAGFPDGHVVAAEAEEIEL